MNLRKLGIVPLLCTSLAWGVSAQTGLETGMAVELPLGGVGHDMAVDDARSLIYVSIPTLNEIVAVSSLSLAVVGRMSPGNDPRGIDISGDGTTLYVALRGAGSVAVVDLGTFTRTTTLDVGTLLDSSLTWDVAEGMPGEVFVSANPGSGGFAYIVRIDRNAGGAAARVASNRIIRASPTFRVSPDLRFLYVGEGFSPNSLYKLDITQANAPIILEDNHGSVSGTLHTALEPSGDRVFLSSGQVLSTATFSQVGTIGGGVSVISRDGDWAFAIPTTFSTGPDRIEVYATSNLSQQQTIPLNCTASAAATVATLDGDRGVLVLADDRLCGRVLPAGSVCALPGTGEDLRLISQGNTLNCKEVDTSETVTIRLESPGGGMVGALPVLALEAHDGVNTPQPPPGYAGLQFDPTRSLLLFQHLGGGPIGPFVLPAQGMVYSFAVHPVFATMSLRVQGLGLSMSAANGIYAATEGHDLAFVTGSAPQVASVIPPAAAPGETVTLLGASFEPGMDVVVDGVRVTPTVHILNTVVFAAPASLGCDTTIRLRNPGGRSQTVPFNPSQTISQTVNSSGPAAGGTPLVIHGSGFVPGIVTTVDGAAASILSYTGNSVVVLTPPGIPGQVDVVLTAPNGCVATTFFTYL